jgi:hypothetical protein
VSHVNQQVRDAVTEALRDSEAFRTVQSTQANLVDAELPAAAPATLSDTVEPFSKGPPRQEIRTVALTIALVIEGDADSVENDLDALRTTVEGLVPTALDSIARELQHTGSEQELAEDEDGERWYGFLVLAWDVFIVTAVGDSEVALL